MKHSPPWSQRTVTDNRKWERFPFLKSKFHLQDPLLHAFLVTPTYRLQPVVSIFTLLVASAHHPRLNSFVTGRQTSHLPRANVRVPHQSNHESRTGVSRERSVWVSLSLWWLVNSLGLLPQWEWLCNRQCEENGVS